MCACVVVCADTCGKAWEAVVQTGVSGWVCVLCQTGQLPTSSETCPDTHTHQLNNRLQTKAVLQCLFLGTYLQYASNTALQVPTVGDTFWFGMRS